MRERFGASPETARPSKREVAPSSSIEHGEKIGISEKAFSSYVSALEREGGVRSSLRLVVEEWKTPHGKVPATTEVYLTSKKGKDATTLELRALHPEDLDEEMLGSMLGEAVPRALNAKETSASREKFEAMMQERRREIVLKEIQLSIKDAGVRHSCEELIKTVMAGESHEKTAAATHDIGIDLLHAINAALEDSSQHAVTELSRVTHRFNALWAELSSTEQDKLRREIAHATS